MQRFKIFSSDFIKDHIDKVFLYLIGAIFVLGLLIFFIIGSLVSNLPKIDTLEDYTPHLITTIYDVNNTVIDELFVERRTLVPLSDIPVDLQNAIIAIEDSNFFQHWGVDFQGIARASLANLRKGKVVEGGSTITQQLAKVLFLTRRRTLSRKIRELMLALQLERDYTKEEILQLYLNQIYFGQGAYGVQAASRVYFNKKVIELNLAECALLAGLPRAPNRYSPFVDISNAYRRRSIVLNRMVKLGYISQEEAHQANYHPLTVENEQVLKEDAPYFVEYIRQYLEKAYGSNAIYKGGLKVYTTLDLNIQTIAEEVLAESLDRFDIERKEELEKEKEEQEQEKEIEEEEIAEEEPSEEDEELIEEELPKVQGAIVAIDPRTGQIRIMVGGRDFKESQFNRVAQAHRQPGSAFKPFIYISAIDSGYTLNTIIEDSPIAYYNDGDNWKLLSETTDLSDIDPEIAANIDEEKLWIPQNYKEKFRGSILMRDALVNSVNICTVKLLDMIRPITAVYYAQKMGINSRLTNTLSLALGTSEVTPLEITSAYATIANNGIKTEPYAIIRVEDPSGKVLEENFPQEKEVLNAQTNYLITHLMKKVCEEGTGWYTRYLKRPRAGKTGTTNEFTDAWFIGFVPNIVCGVWVGYDDTRTLGDKKAGGVVAAPIWTTIMKRILTQTPILEFPVPQDIVFVKINPRTGLLALEDSPGAILMPFVKGTEPTDYFLIDETSSEEGYIRLRERKKI